MQVKNWAKPRRLRVIRGFVLKIAKSYAAFCNLRESGLMRSLNFGRIFGSFGGIRNLGVWVDACQLCVLTV